jgi:multimeric flavodoxin WrbA
MKVVAFNGSPRKQGNTSRMLSRALGEMEKEGIETELVQVGGKTIRGCIACFKCFENKDNRCAVDSDILNECIEKMIGADGILIGSPVYFSNMSSETKALIDRAGIVTRVNGDLLKRKVGAAVTVARRAGAVFTFDAINHFFTIGQMIIVGSSYWNVGFGREIGEVEKDEEGLMTMTHLGQNMAWLLKKIAE